MPGMNAADLDAIFNGAGVAINAAQNITSAIAGGINDVRNVMDNSRRNSNVYPQQNYQNFQPVTYGYAYSDNGYNYGGFVNYNNQNMNVGYPGFTNPNYGALIGNYAPSTPTQDFNTINPINPGGARF